MDQVYTTKSPTRPHLDRERRRAVIFRHSLATPGYRHTIGIAQGLAFHRRSRLHHHWHFVRSLMLFDTEQWRRIDANFAACPLASMEHVGSLRDVSPACRTERVLWLTTHWQQTCLFHRRVFVFGPLAILTGIAMSPAVVNRFPCVTHGSLVAGNRPRSIHFLTMFSFLAHSSSYTSL